MGVALAVEVAVESPQAGVMSSERSRAEAFCEAVIRVILHTFACACMTQHKLALLRAVRQGGQGLLPMPRPGRYNNGLRKHDR